MVRRSLGPQIVAPPRRYLNRPTISHSSAHIVDYADITWVQNIRRHRRTGQHPLGGGWNRVLPEWRTPIVCSRGPARKKKFNFCSIYLLTVVEADGYLFRSVTRLVKQMCCLLPECGGHHRMWGSPPPLTPRPVRLCTSHDRCFDYTYT